MNIALSAVIIFILLLPPIAFYISFAFGKFQKSGPKLGLLEGIMLSAVFALILHTTGIVLIQREIRFDIFALLIGGDLRAINSLVTNTTLKNYLQQFALYSSLLTLIAIISGRFFRWKLQQSHLHVRSEALRLYNHWWYLFRGYKIDSFINQRAPRLFDLVFVDVLVNTNAGTMLYSGYLVDFVCQGEILDRIYLSDARKRDYKKNKLTDKGNILVNESGSPKSIKGDIISIPYSGIINMNIHFLDLSAEMEEIDKHETFHFSM